MNVDFADVILAIGNTNYVAVNEEVGEKMPEVVPPWWVYWWRWSLRWRLLWWSLLRWR